MLHFLTLCRKLSHRLIHAEEHLRKVEDLLAKFNSSLNDILETSTIKAADREKSTASPDLPNIPEKDWLNYL